MSATNELMHGRVIQHAQLHSAASRVMWSEVLLKIMIGYICPIVLR